MLSQLKTSSHRNTKTVFPKFAPALCQNNSWMPNDIESSKGDERGKSEGELSYAFDFDHGAKD